jgi:transposase
VELLGALPAPVPAAYETGPTRFGLARAPADRGIVVPVVAPGSVPKGPGDGVKTDKRDAVRLVRLSRPERHHQVIRPNRFRLPG